MPKIGKVIIRCPEMSILATRRPWIRECQELFCRENEIVLEDGTTVPFVITFPRALVRWRYPGAWLVDEVPAKGETKDGRPINVTMDKERVTRSSWRTVEAQPCSATGSVELFGKTWKIGPRVSPAGDNLFFPKCTATAAGLGLFKYVAEPITAEGVVLLG
ncbi:MAG TPA: hypothetical protein VNX28_13720 [Gemmataceae bacterium]|nr:hypothetical protein [Gemmataceae bacterium]